jgi:hypothetical protein
MSGRWAESLDFVRELTYRKAVGTPQNNTWEYTGNTAIFAIFSHYEHKLSVVFAMTNIFPNLCTTPIF